MHELIDRAIDMTAGVVAAIDDAQWTLPTPCVGWDVRAELNHVVGGMRIFTAQLGGPGVDPDAGHDSTDWLGVDPRAAYADAAEADRAAWRAPDALERTVTISLGALPGPMAATIHLTEVLTHGADLAVAIGRTDLVDEGLCADLLGIAHRIGGVDPYRVPGVFGPEVGEPADGAAHRRLLAYLGRTL